MTTSDPTPTIDQSRRRLLKLATVATTGALVGSSPVAGAVERADERREDERTAHGQTFSYQFVPNAPFSIVESDLEWRPNALGETNAGYVLEYAHAPSMRSFFFTDATVPGIDEGTFAFEAERRAPDVSTGRSLIGVTASRVD